MASTSTTPSTNPSSDTLAILSLSETGTVLGGRLPDGEKKVDWDPISPIGLEKKVDWDPISPITPGEELRIRIPVIDDGWSENPANPLNWSFGRKWRNVAIVSLYTFISPLASSTMAPSLPQIAAHYDITNPTVVALTLSIYLLAFAVGPLIAGPLSEMYGRALILHASNLFFMVFTFACIFAPNTLSLILFRFLAGLGGGTPLAIGGGSISDLFIPSERGTAMSVYTLGILLGPVVGPISGGFMAESTGFKWVFILLTILAGFASLIGIPFLEETNPSVIKERIFLRQRRKDPEVNEKEIIESLQLPPRLDLVQALRTNLSRPFMLLTHSLICFMLSLYMALIYGYLYLMFTTFPVLFGHIYGWGPGHTGLAYLGPGLGFVSGALAGGPLLSRVYSKLSKINDGKGKPEFHIPIACLGSILIPIGLFWYGWSAQARLHWIMPLIGGGFFALGMVFVYIPLQLYLVDVFTYAASVLAAVSVFRALFGFSFPLFGEQMFATMGLGGGNSLLAGLAIVTGIPFPIFLYYKGERIRARNVLTR